LVCSKPTINEEVFEKLISIATEQNDVSKFLTDYQYVIKPISATTCLNIWCKDVETEMFAYFKRHPEQLYSLHQRKFEEFVAAIFKNNGFSVQLTPETRDKGVDIIAIERSSLTGESIHLIECKRTPHILKLELVLSKDFWELYHIFTPPRASLLRHHILQKTRKL
jgi:restriction system protein